MIRPFTQAEITAATEAVIANLEARLAAATERAEKAAEEASQFCKDNDELGEVISNLRIRVAALEGSLGGYTAPDWVCEWHPEKPWGTGEGECECGAGMPGNANSAISALVAARDKSDKAIKMLSTALRNTIDELRSVEKDTNYVIHTDFCTGECAICCAEAAITTLSAPPAPADESEENMRRLGHAVMDRIAEHTKDAGGPLEDWTPAECPSEVIDDLVDMIESLQACGAKPAADVLADAERYRWLRARDLDTIHKGGVFAGMTPDNVVLNGEDLDNAVDVARLIAAAQAEREG